MRGISRDCLVEMFDRKIIMIFGIITLLVVIGVLFTGNMEISFDSNMNLGDLNRALGNPMMKFFGFYLSFLVFMATMATAGLIPNMFIKGRADYYLSKPISRAALLGNKLLGVWLSYGGLIFASSMVVYITITLIHGGFEIRVLYLIFVGLMSFLVWLVILFFAGILFGSQMMSIMAAFLFWVLHNIFSSINNFKDFFDSEVIRIIINAIYQILPKNAIFFDIGESLVLGDMVGDWMPFYTTIMFAVFLYSATNYIFQRKSY